MSKEKLYYLAQIYHETFISNLKQNFENLVKRLRLSWISDNNPIDRRLMGAFRRTNLRLYRFVRRDGAFTRGRNRESTAALQIFSTC